MLIFIQIIAQELDMYDNILEARDLILQLDNFQVSVCNI